MEESIMNMDTTILPDEDVELAQAARNDPAAFKQLYQKWLQPVYRYFYFRVGSEKDAEDLTSQVFLKVYEALPQYHKKGDFTSWLFSIAHARVVDYYRKPVREVPLDQINGSAQMADPLALAAKNDDIQSVLHLLQSCSEEEQELIRLRYMADLNYRQIGAVMNRSEEAVRKSLSRLISRLQTQLEDSHD
jgi:RNA polymerase sigma-70 factor, ECF subfamily